MNWLANFRGLLWSAYSLYCCVTKVRWRVAKESRPQHDVGIPFLSFLIELTLQEDGHDTIKFVVWNFYLKDLINIVCVVNQLDSRTRQVKSRRASVSPVLEEMRQLRCCINQHVTLWSITFSLSISCNQARLNVNQTTSGIPRLNRHPYDYYLIFSVDGIKWLLVGAPIAIYNTPFIKFLLCRDRPKNPAWWTSITNFCLLRSEELRYCSFVLL